MANPYHDPYSGKFCSRGEMSTLISTALSDGNFERYSTFRAIVEQADKERDSRILDGFNAVKGNDLDKLRELVGSKLTDIADSSEERDILSGWSKNATPETLDMFLSNPNFSSTAFQQAYENLTEEDKLNFIRKNNNLSSSKFSYKLSDMMGDPRSRDNKATHARVEALLEREKLSPDAVDVAKRAIGPHALIAKIRKDYTDGSRTSWPFVAASYKQESGLLYDTSSSAGAPSRLLFAEYATNPRTLASIGAHDSVAVDKVLDNPNSDTKTIATILAKNNSLTSAQYLKAKTLLAARSDLPDNVVESLKYKGSVTPAYSDQETTAMLREVKIATRMISHSRRTVLGRSSDEMKEQARKTMAEYRKTFDTTRAKLDSSDQNYDSLVKQERYLEKNSYYDNTSHKRVKERLLNADVYRNQKGGLDKLRESLRGLTYEINLLRKSY
jgi:hypothetical protein